MDLRPPSFSKLYGSYAGFIGALIVQIVKFRITGLLIKIVGAFATFE